MNERKSFISNEGLRSSRWFLPVLIVVLIVVGFFYNKSTQGEGELHLKRPSKLDTVSSQISTLPLNIYLSAMDYKDGKLTVNISNQSGYEMTFSDEFDLEKEVNGTWEILEPETPIAESGNSYTIADLRDVDIICDLTPYGEQITAGHYHLIKNDCIADFTLE